MTETTPFVAVLMAGGRGQRFWPLSTEARPKQFLDLENCGRSLLQNTYDRVLPLTQGPDYVFVATAARYLDLIKEQLPELPERNVIVEPVGRDSAPAIALASLHIEDRFGEAIAGFFSSDHRIGQAERFRATVKRAEALARHTAGLTTIGIEPTFPATGYGYVQAGKQIGEGYKVARFVEKPNRDRAERYVAQGNYYWNGGIFVWPTRTMLSELERYAPGLMTPLKRAFAEGELQEVFSGLEKISIDYAVLEKTDKAYVVPGDFEWDDIGDWVALERLLSGDDDGANTVVGQHIGLETHSNIIYTDSEDDVVVTLGVENLVVVKKGNTVLLVRKDRVQDIKTLLNDERLASLSLG